MASAAEPDTGALPRDRAGRLFRCLSTERAGVRRRTQVEQDSPARRGARWGKRGEKFPASGIEGFHSHRTVGRNTIERPVEIQPEPWAVCLRLQTCSDHGLIGGPQHGRVIREASRVPSCLLGPGGRANCSPPCPAVTPLILVSSIGRAPCAARGAARSGSAREVNRRTVLMGYARGSRPTSRAWPRVRSRRRPGLDPGRGPRTTRRCEARLRTNPLFDARQQSPPSIPPEHPCK